MFNTKNRSKFNVPKIQGTRRLAFVHSIELMWIIKSKSTGWQLNHERLERKIPRPVNVNLWKLQNDQVLNNSTIKWEVYYINGVFFFRHPHAFCQHAQCNHVTGYLLHIPQLVWTTVALWLSHHSDNGLHDNTECTMKIHTDKRA